MKGESNGKIKKRRFFYFSIAEPPPVLFKDNANERNESLLSDFRVQLILFKDSERRVQWQEKRGISFHIAGCLGGLWHI